jgi:hypothetical protein
MSDSFKELDLNNLGSADLTIDATPDDIEIVEEGAPAPTQAPPAAEPDDDDDHVADEGAERKRLSRSQRLKIQRDAYAQRIAELEATVEKERAERTRIQAQNEEAATAGYDFYLTTLDNGLTSLRAEFNAAYDAGDKDKVFEVQQRMAELVAEKKQVERERRARPTKAEAPASGGVARPPTPQTTEATETAPRPQAGKPNPLVQHWYERNKSWFNQDAVMTAAARAIDSQLTSDGFDSAAEDYFEELDKRLAENFPHKFGKKQEAAAPAKKVTPTIQNRATAAMPGTKIKVTITASDREMARQLNVPIEDYARQKAKREMAENTSNGYTEIV